MTRKRFVKLVMAGGLQDKREAIDLAQYIHQEGIGYSRGYVAYSETNEVIAGIFLMREEMLNGFFVDSQRPAR